MGAKPSAFYDRRSVERLLGAKTARKRAEMHADAFGGAVPEGPVGEAVARKSLSKKMLVRAAVRDMQRSGRADAWIAPHVARHALPWGSGDDYGEAADFAFRLLSR